MNISDARGKGATAKHTDVGRSGVVGTIQPEPPKPIAPEVLRRLEREIRDTAQDRRPAEGLAADAARG